MVNLKVSQVVPAPAHTARWLCHLLDPVIAAVRFERVPPIEIRSTAPWRGWSNPSGYICISGRASFWRPVEVVDVVLHEWAHALIQRIENADVGHDAAFFCVNYALRLRADAAGASPAAEYSLAVFASLYDVADLPESLHDDPDRGVGRCIAWSVALAAELAASERSAEQLAREVVRRYQNWLVELADRPRLAEIAKARATRQARDRADAVARLSDKLFVSNVVAGLSVALLLLLGVMLSWR